MTNTDITETNEAPIKKTKLFALPRSAAKLAESTNNTWRVVIPKDVPRERLTDSDLWAVIAGDLLPFDKIRCVGEGRNFYAELLVVEAGKGYASLVELNYTPLPVLMVSKEGLPPNHEIIHLGADELYAVRRISDNHIMEKGFPNRKEALDWLLQHATLQ